MCRHCRHGFIDHTFLSHELENLYSQYYPRSNLSISDYKPSALRSDLIGWLNGEARSAFAHVPANVRVLDIGCGFAQSIGYHKSRNCDAYGVEADENVKKVIDKYAFNIKLGLFNYKDYQESYFDYITMDQVLEHIQDPVFMLRGVSKILKNEGKVIISIPNFNGWGVKFFGKKWINWHIPYHLHHYSKTSIRKLADSSGLEVESIKTITCSEWLNYQWHSIATYPRRGDKSVFWSPTIKHQYKFWQIVCFKFLSLIHKLKINHIFTRFFDFLGLGDNLLVILKKSKA
jgi:2-polyprenyl-3-methyl-5-hydroxy-6-metoxy-1,4-benzoquinol methylase